MTLEPDALELVPLGLATITLNEPTILQGVPAGTFVVAELASTRVEGDRLCASSKGRPTPTG